MLACSVASMCSLHFALCKQLCKTCLSFSLMVGDRLPGCLYELLSFFLSQVKMCTCDCGSVVLEELKNYCLLGFGVCQELWQIM